MAQLVAFASAVFLPCSGLPLLRASLSILQSLAGSPFAFLTSLGVSELILMSHNLHNTLSIKGINIASGSTGQSQAEPTTGSPNRMCTLYDADAKPPTFSHLLLYLEYFWGRSS